MFIRIESSSGVPITRQIVDQIRNHAASGTLAAGDRMPSVRQLSKELAVNQNTILRVYERLTAEGLLESRQGDGTYVADALPKGRAKAQREQFERELERVAHRSIDLTIERSDVHELLDKAFGRVERQRERQPERASHTKGATS